MTETQPETGQPRTFTATVEAQHADDLRAERDRSDDDIRDDYIQRISDTDVAADRARATATRTRWERDAAVSALHIALNRVDEAARRPFPSRDLDDETVEVVADDLDGATITITIHDLVATATVALPDRLTTA